VLVSRWLLDLQQFHLKREFGIWRDLVAGPALPITQFRWNDQLAFAARLHAGNPFVPTLDHSPLAKREFKRLLAVQAAVELRAVLEPAGVMNLHRVPRLGGFAGAFFEFDVF